tara:strand:- start:1313 stop:1708 length:396 start_codon:yes stop_codon:yes gene_type:complete
MARRVEVRSTADIFKTSQPIQYDDVFTLEERSKISRSIKLNLHVWQTDFNQPMRRTNIKVVRELFLHPDTGQLLEGLYIDDRNIVVWAGKSMEVPALYHEFCHMYDHTKGHANPKWPEWDARGDRIAGIAR